jgi:hypothetical protein
MAKLIAALICSLAFAVPARAASFLSLDESEYPPAVTQALQEVRAACKESGHQPLNYPQIGVTVLDLNRDGSKDILLQAWQACDFPIKGAGCNTAGCVIEIFKQVGAHKWKKIFDETVSPQFFLSASEKGYFNLLAISVSRKISDRCPDPSGGDCDYLLRWKGNKFVWDRIR